MGLYKRGDTYWIDYYVNGKRMREAVGTRQEARVVLGERLQGIRQGKHPELMKLEAVTFKAHAAEVLAKHYAGKRSREWAKIVIDVHLVPFFGAHYLATITPRMVSEYVAGRLAAGMSRATANNERAVLSKVMSLAVEWNRLPQNPVRKVKKLENNNGRLRFLTRDEADALIAKAPDHLRPVIVTALETMGRLSEVLGLKWDDVDLERGILYFDQTNTKNARQREIPMTPLLTAALKERARVRAIGGDAREYVFTRFGRRLQDVRTAFEKARTRAGLGTDVTFHTLRHTGAAWYISRPGSDLNLLRDLLGHQDLRTTMIYAHLSPQYRKSAVALMGMNGGAAADGHKSVTPGKEQVA
jgi:integrase